MGNAITRKIIQQQIENIERLWYLILNGDLATVLKHVRRITPRTYKTLTEPVNHFGYAVPSPVAMAAFSGRLDVMEELISRAFPVNEMSVCGVMRDAKSRPIHFASGAGHVDIVRALVETHGVGVYKMDSAANTPLDVAVWNGHQPVVEYFVEKGVDVNPTRYTPSPLRLALHRKHARICEYLVQHGADVNERNSRNSTLLADAVSRVDESMVHTLLNLGAER